MQTRLLAPLLMLLSLSFCFIPAHARAAEKHDGPSATTTREEQDTTAQPPARENQYESFDSLTNLYQPYLVNLTSYEPMYFLVGADPKKSKFQISLKYQFFTSDNPTGGRHPWLQGLHFGYTQTSFWDLGSTSAPFEDTSYKPELFYLSTNIRSRPSWLKGFYLQSGLQHESNGRAGEFSRGANTVYATPILILYNESSQLGLMVAPKVWAYFDKENDTNPDLDDYRGCVDLEVKCGKADNFVLGTHLRWAAEGPSIQMDLTYPLHHILFKNLDLYLQVQYVSVLAESLLDYTERTTVLRFGFAVVR